VLTLEQEMKQKTFFFHFSFKGEDEDDEDEDEEPTIEQCKKYIKSCPKGEKGKTIYSRK
jgi:hypothetical protein